MDVGYPSAISKSRNFSGWQKTYKKSQNDRLLKIINTAKLLTIFIWLKIKGIFLYIFYYKINSTIYYRSIFMINFNYIRSYEQLINILKSFTTATTASALNYISSLPSQSSQWICPERFI